MATYMKPTSKLFDLPSRGGPGELNLTDIMCPVCRGILIEPVTLPCAHSLCLRCLNGTIQHNSLSCPLCRVRVGSWLRTATKSSTLVNDGLWKIIKQRFAKEIQAKNDGVETDIDSGFVTTTNKILSAAGEIRREYEAQLQLAEEENRRRREAERIASEALIRKIQAEEREEITQLARDNAVAKSLASKNLISRHEDDVRPDNRRSKDGVEWDSNIALISKLRAESYAASEMKSAVVSASACFVQSFEEPRINSGKSTAGRHQLIGSSTLTYAPKPGCSNSSKIYGTQSKEELHVPSDVLNRKKKSLGVEVCLATQEDKERRIGSAESTGSHDSINIEIHHFKPIKAMPRTPLRTMPDGRQIDPKLIRVVAILKRVQNAVPKPPTLMQLKRLSGCSYSAFKGKSKKVLKQDPRPLGTNLVKEEAETRPSTSSNLHNQPQSSSNNKLSKSQVSETVRRLDLSSEISYDGNKNYAKNINRIINGTKVSKKLILDEDVCPARGAGNKTATNSSDNPGKFRRRKYNNSSSNEREELSDNDIRNNESADEASSSYSSAMNPDGQTASDHSSDEVVPAVENIAERIKKRKVSRGRSHRNSTVSSKRRRVVEKKITRGSQQAKGKHRRLDNKHEDSDEEENVDSRGGDRTEAPRVEETAGGKRSTRNSVKVKTEAEVEEEEEDEGLREQKRIERLLIQEKKDFELAQRLQAKFDEMERISGRTRGSRRGGGTGVVVSGLNSKNIEQVLSAGHRQMRSDRVGIKERFTKRLLIQDDENPEESQNSKRRVTRRRCVQ